MVPQDLSPESSASGGVHDLTATGFQSKVTSESQSCTGMMPRNQGMLSESMNYDDFPLT